MLIIIECQSTNSINSKIFSPEFIIIFKYWTKIKQMIPNETKFQIEKGRKEFC